MYKYFYSWYLLPIVYLHEFMHFITAKIVNIKVHKFLIYKECDIYNGKVITDLPDKQWKQNVISWSPILIPIFSVLLVFVSNVFFIFIFYLLTTIIYYDNHWIFMGFPSRSDIQFAKNLDYHNYISKKIGEEYYELRENGNLVKTINNKCLLSLKKYKLSKEK